MKRFVIVLVIVVFELATGSNLLDDFSVANQKFTVDIYKNTQSIESGNFLVCPLSAEIILALTRFGAKGKTATQLALNIDNTNEEIEQMFREIFESVNSKKDYSFSLANNIIISDKYQIKEQFKEVAKNTFEALVQSVDFTKLDNVIQYINVWVRSKTNRKIEEIITNKDIDPTTAAVFLNALYFHGNWLMPFDKMGTFLTKFHVNNKEEIQVEMMSTEAYFNYYQDDNLQAQFLELPFEGGDVTMTFVLPNKKFNLSKLESRIVEVLTPPKYKQEQVNVFIPKFKMESKINLKSILISMGVRLPFSSEADFRGITDTMPPLIIDNVIQKTFLEVNEQGATAAASTAVVLIPMSMPQNVFSADHPFLYYLKHKSAGIFFIGRYITPEGAKN